MKKFLSYLSIITYLVITPILHASDCNSCPLTGCAFLGCNSPCNTCNSCCPSFLGGINTNAFYTGASVLYATDTHDFDGWGAMAHLGYIFCCTECGKQAVEFEAGYIHESGQRTASRSDSTNLGNPNGPLINIITLSNRSGKLDMVPLLLNYVWTTDLGCLGSSCCNCPCLSLSLGAGLGVNIYKKIDKDFASSYMSSLVISEPHESSKTKAAMAGQLFCRLNYNLSDCWQVYTGARAFFTQKVYYGKGSVSPMNTSVTHLLIDLGISFGW